MLFKSNQTQLFASSQATWKPYYNIKMNESDTGIEKEVIPFALPSTLSQHKTVKVKYTISGTTFKTQLPIFKEGTSQELLHFVNEFQQAKIKLGYTTYQKLESGFEQLLQGIACHEWTTIKATVGPNTNAVATFTNRLEAF